MKPTIDRFIRKCLSRKFIASSHAGVKVVFNSLSVMCSVIGYQTRAALLANKKQNQIQSCLRRTRFPTRDLQLHVFPSCSELFMVLLTSVVIMIDQSH